MIIKVNKSENYIKSKVIDSIGNAHYFISKFYNGDRANNPHGITYKQMFDEFGEPNYIDDYKGSAWWILSFNEDLYTIDVCKREGSMVCKVFDDVEFRCYDKNFSKNAEEFHKQLFKQI